MVLGQSNAACGLPPSPPNGPTRVIPPAVNTGAPLVTPVTESAAQSIVKGMYLFKGGDKKAKAPRVQLLGSGTIFREVIEAANLLRNDWGVESDLWSCPSFTELARDGSPFEAIRRSDLQIIHKP